MEKIRGVVSVWTAVYYGACDFCWREMFVYGYVQFSLLRDLMIFYMTMMVNGKLLYRKESPSKISMKLKSIEHEIR